MTHIEYDGLVFNWLSKKVYHSQHNVVETLKQKGVKCCDTNYRNWMNYGIQMKYIGPVCNALHFSHVYLFDYGDGKWTMKDFHLTDEKYWKDISIDYTEIVRGYANHKGMEMIVNEKHLLTATQFDAITENRGDMLTNFNSGIFCNLLNELQNCPFGVFDDENIPRRLNKDDGVREYNIPGIDIRKIVEKYPDNIFVKNYIEDIEKQKLQNQVKAADEKYRHLEEEFVRLKTENSDD